MDRNNILIHFLNMNPVDEYLFVVVELDVVVTSTLDLTAPGVMVAVSVNCLSCMGVKRLD